MMLTNNKKADQAKSPKTEPQCDSILEQVLSLVHRKRIANLDPGKAHPRPQKQRKHPDLQRYLAPIARNLVTQKINAIISTPNKPVKVFVSNLKAES